AAFDAQRQAGICAGLDFRYNLASDLALVGTLNPDFGQVEADSRVLNLTTFETFFPEKRPFFLEGLDLFKLPLRVDIGGPYGGDAGRRVRGPLGGNGLFGATATAVDPILSDPALGLQRRHAHVGEGDLTLYNSERSWAGTFQALGSLLSGNTPETLRDGTFRG